ncbi:hypothetical protein ALC53_06359 [Atta colombica]|uniref:Uncharacterized protein n=1 Tax=Atta colombica TaxID=520822 RepID=A0A195BEU2_9HYME|nr:hypothetical protein ALC53_06359 [Atta colombica]
MGDKVGGGYCEEEMKRGWGDSEETRAIGIYPKTRTRGYLAHGSAIFNARSPRPS